MMIKDGFLIALLAMLLFGVTPWAVGVVAIISWIFGG